MHASIPYLFTSGALAADLHGCSYIAVRRDPEGGYTVLHRSGFHGDPAMTPLLIRSQDTLGQPEILMPPTPGREDSGLSARYLYHSHHDRIGDLVCWRIGKAPAAYSLRLDKSAIVLRAKGPFRCILPGWELSAINSLSPGRWSVNRRPHECNEQQVLTHGTRDKRQLYCYVTIQIDLIHCFLEKDSQAR